MQRWEFNDNILAMVEMSFKKLADYRREDKKMTHADMWAAIEELAHSQKLSCSALAKKSGLDATTFNKSKRVNSFGKPRWPSTQSVAKILEATGTSIEEFIKFIPRH